MPWNKILKKYMQKEHLIFNRILFTDHYRSRLQKKIVLSYNLTLEDFEKYV